MSDSVKIYWNDLTEEAKAKMMEFDSEIPHEITSGFEEMITIRKSPKRDDAIKGLIDGLLDRVKERVAMDKIRSEVPEHVLAEAKRRHDNDEDIAGVLLNKETGNYTFLTEAESLEALKDDDVGYAGRADIMVDEKIIPLIAIVPNVKPNLPV